MARTIDKIKLDEEQRTELERRVKIPKTSKRDHLRARIIILRAENKSTKNTAEQLRGSMVTVSKWTSRFKKEGLPALIDKK